MDSRSAKAAALLAIAECLRFGVTSVSDLYYYPNATAEAVAESGIKANLALSSYRYIDRKRGLRLRDRRAVPGPGKGHGEVERLRRRPHQDRRRNLRRVHQQLPALGRSGGLRRRAESGNAAASCGDPERSGLLSGAHRHEPRGAAELPQCFQPSHYRRGLYIFNRGRA